MVDWTDEMDNVEWLRKSASDEWCGSALNKCADEIERLREEVERLKSEESCNDVLLEYAQAETQRLREENAQLQAQREKDKRLNHETESGLLEENVRLREENARLREAVKAAYYEGWQDNASIDDTEDRLHAEWAYSEACAAIREGDKNG